MALLLPFLVSAVKKQTRIAAQHDGAGGAQDTKGEVWNRRVRKRVEWGTQSLVHTRQASTPQLHHHPNSQELRVATQP